MQAVASSRRISQSRRTLLRRCREKARSGTKFFARRKPYEKTIAAVAERVGQHDKVPATTHSLPRLRIHLKVLPSRESSLPLPQLDRIVPFRRTRRRGIREIEHCELRNAHRERERDRAPSGRYARWHRPQWPGSRQCC